jgi:hypothetical protein
MDEVILKVTPLECQLIVSAIQHTALILGHSSRESQLIIALCEKIKKQAEK